MSVNLIKTNFSAGEVSPAMFGRPDTVRYKNGAAEIENFVCQPQGGLVRRMGTKFVSEVLDSTKFHRLFSFKFSNIQAYVLEFGENTIRILTDTDGFILDPSDMPNPLVVTTNYLSTHLPDVYPSQSADVFYLAHPEVKPNSLLRYSPTEWVFQPTQIEDGPYQAPLPGDSSITLWLTSILHRATIKSTAADFVSGDVGKHVEFWKDGSLIIGEIKTFVDAQTVTIEPKENVVDRKDLDKQAVLTVTSTQIRSSLSIWSSETEYSYIRGTDGTWYYMTTHDPIPVIIGDSPESYAADVMNRGTSPTMKAGITGKLSFSDEIITAVLNSSEDLFLDPDDIDRHVRLDFSNRVVWGYLTAITNAKTANIRLGTRVPYDPRNGQIPIDNATTTQWKLGAWYAGNYPRTVTLHQGRLVYAGTDLEPNRIWMSESDDYVSFATTNLLSEVLDSSAINVGIVSGQVNSILWLQSGPVLLIGTNGEEFQIKPTSINEVLTSANINVTSQTPYGSEESIRPIKIGPSTLFVQLHGQRLRELVYNFEIDSFTASDATIVSEHIFRKHISAEDMAYAQTPNSTLWFICEDGNPVSLTYEKDQQVYAWTNHKLGGNGFAESITAIPSAAGKQDRVYMVVRRTINGVQKRYIERLHDEYNPTGPQDKAGMAYLDCSIRYEGAATTVISGLDHLEGEEVDVIANFAVHPKRTVISGQIDLQYPATNVLVGYGYTSLVKTLPEVEGSQVGTAFGKTKKIVRVDAQLNNTIGLKFGTKLNDMSYPKAFRETNGIMGQSPDLFSGFIELTWDSPFEKNGQFYILQDQPYPCNILSLSPVLKVNE